MRALDVMTTKVITVKPEATIPEVARLFVENNISAVPVVDAAGKLIGIVSEGDLLHRAEIGTERRRSWWLELVSSSHDLAADYIKSHASRVRDVMSADVVSVDEATPVADIADLLERKRIKRVPVVRDGKPVGIVSRSNLIKVLAAFSAAPKSEEAETSDQDIRSRLVVELQGHKWCEAGPENIVVRDGVVHLWGYVLSEQERRALRVAAENVPGVRAVKDHTVDFPVFPSG
ncbi:MAG: CBS domain-containing protein [Nevskia sp.]|nr:CBS domain-containing protein [Nevskia sp.]